MTDFLVRNFVKNYEQYENQTVRTAYGVFASIVGILCNIFLFLVKISVGMVLKSVSVMADAFNNLSDAASSVISFVGVKMASKPADEDHPFGHGRIEYIAALIVSFLVIEVGFTFFKTSIDKIQHPEAIAFNVVSLGILTGSICVKLWLGLFNRRLGSRINSSVMKATSADAFGDVLTTTATILSILICHFSGFNVDGFMGLIVSLLVMWSGINIAKDTLAPLIGEAVDPELCKRIETMVESYDGILGTHDLIVHNYGPSRSMASIHAEVPNNVDIEQSHEIIDRIEREVSKELGVLLVIHMDPVETEDNRVQEHKNLVRQVISEIDESVNFHDFRMVDGEKQINLIFDLVVPYKYSKAQQAKLCENIAQEIQKRDERCQCVITVENSFRAAEK
ncbi:MAG: cation transporter [Lachnospiraceae bacterium]|nr:cation transporter [Lachnospiraceae bacterium]